MSSIARTCSAATRKYERLACVGIIQRRGCMRANEYRGYERKYELLACYCVAALTGNVGLRWRLSPRPAGLRCKKFLACVSPARKVAARVAATPLRWPPVL
jgi:hypothetical protein